MALKIKGGTPRTKAFAAFLEKEADRVTGYSIEMDADRELSRVFIYTDTIDWNNGDLSGTFVAKTETAAIKEFYQNVVKTTDEDKAYMRARGWA